MSSAVQPFSKDELLNLLGVSRSWNGTHGITGALFYRDGNFLQVIEGDEGEVRSLFENIRRDRRHHAVSPLFQERILKRDFDQWSMAFYNLERTKSEWPEGFNNLLQRQDIRSEIENYAPKVRAFLQSFIR